MIKTAIRKYAPTVIWSAIALTALQYRDDLVSWFRVDDTASVGAAHEHPPQTHEHATEDRGPAIATHLFADEAKGHLQRALTAYERIRLSLAGDEVTVLKTQALAVAEEIDRALAAEPTIPVSLDESLRASAEAGKSLAVAADLDSARTAFADLSQYLIAAILSDSRLGEGLHTFECTMTDGFNKWLQFEPELKNPYQGSKMLTCGSEIEMLSALPNNYHEHDGQHDGGHHGAVDADDISHYTCPMETWVKRKDPGQCPVCGMDLVAVSKEEAENGTLRIDHNRRQLIGLKTAQVGQRPMRANIDAVGRVIYDESRLSDITLKYDAWIEKLYVATHGQSVRKGRRLLTLYSPELYAAQQDFLLALAERRALQGNRAADGDVANGDDDDAPAAITGSQSLKARQAQLRRLDSLVHGARQRLALWDLTQAQIQRIANEGRAMDRIPILAPTSGYVIAKDIVEGAAVKSGQRLFRIAALDRVWVEADIYEQDIPLVRVGHPATVRLTHLPGQTFAGEVSFVYPYLNSATRTSRVRISLENRALTLKPEMYANVEFSVDHGERLAVPESAVIYTGPRRVVFVDAGNDKLLPTKIEVGLKANGYFEVLSGIKAGDRVVTSSNFLLSAESRLKEATGLW